MGALGVQVALLFAVAGVCRCPCHIQSEPPLQTTTRSLTLTIPALFAPPQALLRSTLASALPPGFAELRPNPRSARLLGLASDLCRSLRAEVDGLLAEQRPPAAGDAAAGAGAGGLTARLATASGAADGGVGAGRKQREVTDAAAEALLGVLRASAAQAAAGLKVAL